MGLGPTLPKCRWPSRLSLPPRPALVNRTLLLRYQTVQQSDSDRLVLPLFQALFLVLCTYCLVESSDLPYKEGISIICALLMRTPKPRVGKTCPTAPASCTEGRGNPWGEIFKPSAHIALQIPLPPLPSFLLGSPTLLLLALCPGLSVHRTGPPRSFSSAFQ